MTERPRPFRPGPALAALVGCQLMVVLEASAVNVALPRLRAELGFTETGLSWVVNAYVLTYGGLLLLGGRSGDLLGRRRMFLAGLWTFTAASLLAGAAPDGAVLIAARALQGVGGAIASPTALALIGTLFEGAERARAIGVYGAVSGVGGAIGLVLGGVLTETLSWRAVMFLTVPLGAGAALLAARHIPESARQPGRFDAPGAALATLGCTALAYAVVHGSEHGWTGAGTLLPAVAAPLLLAAFVLAERRAPQPLVPRALVADRRRLAANALLALLSATSFGSGYLLTQYLQVRLGLGPLATGAAFLPWSVLIFAGARLAGPLETRAGPRAALLAGTVATVGAAALLAGRTPSGYAAGVLPALALFGLGIGLAFAAVTRAGLVAPPELTGAAAGLLNVSQRLGGTVGLAVLVAVGGFGPAFTVVLLYTLATVALVPLAAGDPARTERQRRE
ncbi:MFS transporter [Kitasatospora sp. NPDC004240]